MKNTENITYNCVTCNYTTTKKGDYKKHCSTIKHMKLNSKEIIQNQFVCNCGKGYKSRQGLYYHKKQCVHGKNIICKKIEDNENNISHYCCDCGKFFNDKSNFNRHLISCQYKNINNIFKNNNNNNNELKNVI